VKRLQKLPQGLHGQGDELSSFDEALSAMFKMIGGVFGRKDTKITKEESQAVHAIRGTGLLIKDAGGAIEWSVDTMWSIFKILYYKYYGVPFQTEEVQALVDEAVKWMASFHDFCVKQRPPEECPTAATLQQYVQFGLTGNDICKRLVEAQYNLKNFTSFFRAHEKSIEFANTSTRLLKDSCVRNEPIHIMFAGKPGVGKTQVAMVLMKDLMSASGKDYESTSTY